MDLNTLLEKVTYVSHRERMETYAALTEAERIPLRVEVAHWVEHYRDSDNELADDLRKLQVAIRGQGQGVEPREQGE